MSNTDIASFPAPANCFSHPEALRICMTSLRPGTAFARVWIYGERALEAHVPTCRRALRPRRKHLLFKGHCSERDVTHLVNESGSEAAVVIGVGSRR